MNVKSLYIRAIIWLALLAILALQFLWLYNMYASYQESLKYTVNNSLLQSIENEFLDRKKDFEGPIIRVFYPYPDDTTRMRDFRINTKDTTIVVSCNDVESYNEEKISQLTYKYVGYPLNVYKLDSIFNKILLEKGILVRKTYIECYDKDLDEVTFTTPFKKTPRYQSLETDQFFIDILDSTGVRGHVQISHVAIFRDLFLQLVISAILIIAVVICLFKLSRTIFQQRKEELIKRDFINAMTHELKRPITSSVLVLEYLNEQIQANDLSTADEYLTDAVFALKKLNSYVEKIQEISKGEDGRIDVIKEDVALEPFFLKMKQKYEFAQDKIISIHLQIENGLVLHTDVLHFSNIMENLTENSIKYSGDFVEIEISASKKDGKIQIVHRDNGWGIPETEIDFVFDKFYRGKSLDKRRKNGFGLGLSYVKIMMKNMGGSISVRSVEKEFTEFTLLFPL